MIVALEAALLLSTTDPRVAFLDGPLMTLAAHAPPAPGDAARRPITGACCDAGTSQVAPPPPEDKPKDDLKSPPKPKQVPPPPPGQTGT